MKKLLLIQLPVPHLNYRKQTGNIPLAAGYLKQVLSSSNKIQVDILPESISSYYSDKALIEYISNLKPDLIGYTVYCWNIHRTTYLNNQLKKEFNFISIAGGPEITEDNYLLINHPSIILSMVKVKSPSANLLIPSVMIISSSLICLITLSHLIFLVIWKII
jgi:hypothetical protein